METKAKYIAILPVRQEPNGCLPAFVVPRLLRIEDAAKYLSATTLADRNAIAREDHPVVRARQATRR
jgi:hypothetical protein